MSKNTIYLSLSQAAEETGKSKSVIYKALKNGTISHAGKDESGYKIDPAELFRVFPKNDKNESKNVKKERSGTTENAIENTFKIRELEIRLEAENKEKNFYRDQFVKVEQERDDWKKQAQTLLLQATPPKAPEKPVESRGDFLASPAPKNETRLSGGQIFAAAGVILLVGVTAFSGWYFWPSIEKQRNIQTVSTEQENLSRISPAAGENGSSFSEQKYLLETPENGPFLENEPDVFRETPLHRNQSLPPANDR